MGTFYVGDIEVQIERSRRKTLAIHITPTGKVIAKAPLLYSTFDIKRFVAKKEPWIRAKLKERETRNAGYEPITADELKRLSKMAHKVIPERVDYWAPIVGVKYNRIAIRSQKSKWGSCSSKGNLNFNCLLMMVPGEVLDYVIVHELCHLLEMNHSQRFWAEVARVMPDYKIRRKWLKDNGGILISRMLEGKES